VIVMIKATIFDIQRFSLHDGPGIRTLIFFKGCSLKCEWCSNPEGIRHEPEIRNDKRLCRECGLCVQTCPNKAISKGEGGVYIDRNKCRVCGSCTEICPAGALRRWGDDYTVQQLFDIAKRDMPFYESSGGGVTLGGGDPLLQNEAAVELLAMCKNNGINTAIETAGNYPWEYLENAVPYCDTIHFDLKGWDAETCRKHTGADTHQVIGNLRRLNGLIASMKNKPRLIVRTVILPDYNYTTEDYRHMAGLLTGLSSVDRVEVLPFHNYGQNKYNQLDRPYRFCDRNNLKPEDVEEYRAIIEHAGLPVMVAAS
jgi:pyruvate formate lyase activating enzyme